VLTGIFQGLSAGNYTIYLQDAVGCTDTIMVPIAASNAPVIQNITTTNANCNQDDGTITVIATGGQPPLMYILDGGTPQSSNVFTGVAGGPHTIAVVDDAGCQTPDQNVNVQENGLLHSPS
jgi:hypothetical protein